MLLLDVLHLLQALLGACKHSSRQFLHLEIEVRQRLFAVVLFIALGQHLHQLLSQSAAFFPSSIQLPNILFKLAGNCFQAQLLCGIIYTSFWIFYSRIWRCFSLFGSPFNLNASSCLRNASTTGHSFARDFLRSWYIFLSSSIFLYSSP